MSSEMEAVLLPSNYNSSLYLNINQTGHWEYYNWCIEYPTTMITWSTISMLCFLVGFPANVLVLHELIKRQRQRSNSEIFVLSLAVVDLMFTALIPLCVCNFMIWHSMELQNCFFLIYSLCLNGRPLFMACICWDCYVAVVYPIMYKTSTRFIIAKKVITVTIGFIIIGGAVIIITRLWILDNFRLQGLSLFMTIPVICFCDISILRALRKPDPTGNRNIHPQKKQALYTIANSFIMTFVVYLPPMMIYSLGNLLNFEEVEFNCGLSAYAICFFTVGCVIMPILYLIRIGKLEAFRNWWRRHYA